MNTRGMVCTSKSLNEELQFDTKLYVYSCEILFTLNIKFNISGNSNIRNNASVLGQVGITDWGYMIQNPHETFRTESISWINREQAYLLISLYHTGNIWYMSSVIKKPLIIWINR